MGLLLVMDSFTDYTVSNYTILMGIFLVGIFVLEEIKKLKK